MIFRKRDTEAAQGVGAFDLKTLPDDLREFYEQFLVYGQCATANVKQEYLRIAAEGRVQAHYLSSREFNARAAVFGEGFDIALNVAVPCLLHFVYNITLRLPHVFAGLGDGEPERPYRESDDRRPIPFSLPSTLPIAESLQTLPGVSRPHSDERALFATALTEIACVYCVFHEVGHVIGGHAGYQSQQFWNREVSEFTSARMQLCPWQLIRQVWEREADIIATAMILSFVLTDEGTRRHFSECFQLAGDDDDYPYRIFPVVLFALKLLFLYLAQVPLRLNIRGNHPHPLVRNAYVHNAIRLASADDLGLDLDRLDNLFDQATGLADRVWDDLGLRVPLLEGPESGPKLAEAVERHVVKLEVAHKRLQPRYARWSWIPESAWKEHRF